MSEKSETQEPTFDKEFAQSVLDTFSFFAETVGEKASIELTRIYFTITTLPNYGDEEEEQEVQ